MSTAIADLEAIRRDTARHGWVELEGTANAFTAKAAHVEYVDEQGRTGHAWVWAWLRRAFRSPR